MVVKKDMEIILIGVIAGAAIATTGVMSIMPKLGL
jgi:hypothetical protein